MAFTVLEIIIGEWRNRPHLSTFKHFYSDCRSHTGCSFAACSHTLQQQQPDSAQVRPPPVQRHCCNIIYPQHRIWFRFSKSKIKIPYNSNKFNINIVWFLTVKKVKQWPSLPGRVCPIIYSFIIFLLNFPTGLLPTATGRPADWWWMKDLQENVEGRGKLISNLQKESLTIWAALWRTKWISWTATTSLPPSSGTEWVLQNCCWVLHET